MEVRCGVRWRCGVEVVWWWWGVRWCLMCVVDAVWWRGYVERVDVGEEACCSDGCGSGANNGASDGGGSVGVCGSVSERVSG